MPNTTPIGTAEALKDIFQNWPESAGPQPGEFAFIMGSLLVERIPPEGVTPVQFDEVVLRLLHDTWTTGTQNISNPVTGEVPKTDVHDYLIFSSRTKDFARLAFGPDFAHQLQELNSQTDTRERLKFLKITDMDLSSSYSPPGQEPEHEINEAALPVAKELWSDPSTRIEAMELILGRKVGTDEITPASPLYNQLGIIYRMEDPEDAMPHLEVFKALERD